MASREVAFDWPAEKMRKKLRLCDTSLHSGDQNNESTGLRLLKKRKLRKTENEGEIDPLIQAEDMEIKRLEKLLGISKKSNRRATAEKLNKEYEQFEGIEGDFGDFLMELDDLVENVRKKTKKSKKSSKPADEEDEAPSLVPLNDLHDAKNSMDSELQDDNEENSGNQEQEDHSNAADSNVQGANEDEDSDNDENNSNSDSENDLDEESHREKEKELEKYTYRPSQGEDIYGRVTDPRAASQSTAKYIPPSKRFAANTNTEEYSLLKHRITGLMNKLSDSSRDFVIKELYSILQQHSKYECIDIILQSMYQMTCKPTSIVTAFIPLQVSIIAALFIIQGNDIAALCIENTLKKLVESLLQANHNADVEGNKLPHNYLLILIYLYNFKVLHHTLMSDILLALCSISTSSNQPTLSEENILEHCSLTCKLELIELLIYHCGNTLRQDDPNNLLLAIQHLQTTHQGLCLNATSSQPSTRLVYMLQLLTDLKQGKTRKIMESHLEVLKTHKRALSLVKTSFNKAGHVTSPLRVSLQDLLQVQTRGRWWITGASFNNNTSNNRDKANKMKNDAPIEVGSSEVVKANEKAEKVIAKLASKLQLKTTMRKTILSYLLLSRDIYDVYEKICSIPMQSKEDREVVRVLLECCGKEKTYNPFYSELIKMLCEYSRQYKMSLTYALFDIFKLLPELEGKEKYISNIAQLTANLILSFTQSLTVLRPLDAEAMEQHNTVLFMSVLFVTLFKAPVDEKTFLSVFDRLSTAKDVNEVHGNISFFLEKVMSDIPDKLLAAEYRKQVKSRRAVALKTLRQMKTVFMLGD